MLLEGTYHNAQIPFQNATLDSDEHFPFKGANVRLSLQHFSALTHFLAFSVINF